jgi:hypothetical protein
MADGLLNKASIILTPTGYKAGTLYNVAPVVEPYEDFDFARASIASRVNSSGLVEMVGRTLSSELVTNGDFATDSNWNKGSGWSISGGEASCDGSQSSTSNLTQINVFDTPPQSVTDNYKLNFDLVVTSGSITVSSGNLSQSYTSSGSYVLYGSPQVGSGNLNFTANSTFIGSIDNVSVKEVIDTNNIPRISYDSNGDNGHILLEPTSTNLVPYSQTITELGQQTVTVLDNQTISPDGTQNASSVTKLGTSANDRIEETISVSNSTSYNLSVFVKNSTIAIGGKTTLAFRVSGGTLFRKGFEWGASGLSFTSTYGSGTITNEILEDFGNGWYRIGFSFTTDGTSGDIELDLDRSNGSDTTTLFMWGFQLEALSYATSYIPTLTGSQELRETETATGAGSADLINSTEGVLYAEIAALANDGTSRRISLSNGSISNRVSLELDETSNKIKAFISSGGVSQILEYTASDLTQYNKIAIKYKVNDFALWLGGVERDTDTSGSAPIGLNTLEFAQGSGAQNFYGKCKALAVFNEALSDSELTQLTT